MYKKDLALITYKGGYAIKLYQTKPNLHLNVSVLIDQQGLTYMRSLQTLNVVSKVTSRVGW